MRYLSVQEYSELADSLFNYFFNVSEEYDPAQGRVGCLYQYYLYTHEDRSETKTLLNFHEDLTDEFYQEYDNEINSDQAGLTFGNAYKDAITRVNYINNGSRQLAAILTVGLSLVADLGSNPLLDTGEDVPETFDA